MTTDTGSHDTHSASRTGFEVEVERLRRSGKDVIEWCDCRDGSVVALLWDDERQVHDVAVYRFEDGEFWDDDDAEDDEFPGALHGFDTFDDALAHFKARCLAPTHDDQSGGTRDNPAADVAEAVREAIEAQARAGSRDTAVSVLSGAAVTREGTLLRIILQDGQHYTITVEEPG